MPASDTGTTFIVAEHTGTAAVVRTDSRSRDQQTADRIHACPHVGSDHWCNACAIRDDKRVTVARA